MGKILDFLNPFGIWQEFIVDRLTQNDSINKTTRNYDKYMTDDALMSGLDNITYFYTLDAYPKQLPNSYKSQLRSKARGGVRVSFITNMARETIRWNSYKIKNKKMMWKANMDEREKVDEFNYIDNMSDMANDSWKLQSLVYLPDAEITRKRCLFSTRTMMVISGQRGEVFDKVVEDVLYMANSLGLIFTRVNTQIDEFLSAYSPFKFGSDAKVYKEVGYNVLPDEVISRFSEYTQGKIGRKGVYFGSDIYSGFPVFKQFKKQSVDAENLLVTAMTGGGKSFMVKDILFQLAGDDRFRLTIQDIEGHEYKYLGQFVNNNDTVVTINMSSGSGSYFDAVEIVQTGIPSIDVGGFELSRAFTVNLFYILLGEKILEDSWVENIIEDAVARVYIEAGVDGQDQSTWGNSKGLTYKDVYNKIKETYIELKEGKGVEKFNKDLSFLKNIKLEDIDFDNLSEYSPEELELIYEYLEKIDNEEEYEEISIGDSLRHYENNLGYLDAYDKVIATLLKYFEPFDKGGTHASFFANRVSLEEIKNAKMVINSFGMAGKSEGARSSNSENMAQLFAAFIGQIRTLFAMADGKYNVKVFEEFQRWGKFKGSDRTIGEAITGGRKMGDINIIITNVLKELLDDNRFNIFQNITSFCIGRINEAETRRRVCEELSIPHMQSELDTIANEAGDTATFAEDLGDFGFKSPYDKAFLVCLDGSATTTVRVDLPPSLSGSSIFRTDQNVERELESTR